MGCTADQHVDLRAIDVDGTLTEPSARSRSGE